jgi:serine/threonine protein kinase
VNTNDPNPTPDTPAAATSFAEGQRLAGCYVLTRRLASGHGAEVWLAQDEVLGKNVSLHFIPEAVRQDAGALQALRQDIKRDRQLVHPDILRVYDLVEEPDWAAISMDAAEGESLSLEIEKQPEKRFRIAQVRSWAVQLAQTIDDAHKINVLHRDITPSNLLLTPAGKMIVANFGISRVIQDALARAGGGESSRLAYVSPQLLDGQAPARTDDVYSLGAVLYALLTGAPPFVGQDLGAQIRVGLAPADALQALRKENLAIPPEWQKVIVGCLEKAPEARPQTAAEVARRLAAEGTEPAPAVVAVANAPIKPEPAPASIAATPPAKKAAETAPVKKTIELVPVEKVPEPTQEPVEKEPAGSKSPAFAPPRKRFERKLPSNYNPRPYPTQSRFPATAIVAAAALLVVIAIIYHFASGKRPGSVATVELQPTVPIEKTEPVNATKSPSDAVGQPKPATPRPVAVAAPSATPRIETSTPKPQTPSPVAVAPSSGPERAIAEKMEALEKAKQTAQAAELAHADLLKKQQLADSAVAEVQKAIDEKVKAVAPVKKAAEEALAQRKKLDDDRKAADLAAQQAQQMAAEKARLADEARKSVEDNEKKNQDKLAAQQKADAELEAQQKTLAEKQSAAAAAAKVVSDSDAARQQQLALVKKTEEEIDQAKAAAAEVQRQREAAEAERRKLDQELNEMQRVFKERMADIEAKRKSLENPGATVPGTKPPESARPAQNPATPPPVVSPHPSAMLPLPKPATPEPAKLALNTEPSKTPLFPDAPPALTPTASTTGGAGNSLGMKFVPVGDVEFCIWQTRLKDFDAFAKSVNLRSTSWKGPGFKQGPDHPVVNVTWLEAVAFCKWLTEKEHKEGTLPANQFYRLPTDLEWSKAVGLPEETGKTPEARDMGVQDVYPWGTAWPPPPGAGNYTGEETGSDVAIRGYDDGYAWTSPVGSFAPNKFGIYDMGGNVWQWCMDAWNADSKAKVLRGASWYNGALKLSLLSSCRVHAAPDSSTDNYGFRIVRVTEAAKSGKK